MSRKRLKFKQNDVRNRRNIAQLKIRRTSTRTSIFYNRIDLTTNTIVLERSRKYSTFEYRTV